jgi:hypothetical protein
VVDWAVPIFTDFFNKWQANPALGGGRLTLEHGNPIYDSFENRIGRMSPNISDHAGYAIDVRDDILQSEHKHYMTSSEESATRSIFASMGGKLKWGGDYGPDALDQMHVFIAPGINGPNDVGKYAGTPSSNSSTGTATSTASQPKESRTSGSVGVSMPSFTGVSISLGVSGLSAKYQSVLSSISGGASFADLSGFNNSNGTPAPTSTATTTPSGTTATGDGSGTYSGPTGKGPKWLKNFIKAHNVSEDVAKILWTVGMRETGGDPSEVYNPGGRNLDAAALVDSGSPHFDVGLWQTNNVHIGDIKAMFGASADMFTMKDPEKNFQMTKKLSNNFTKWTDWGITGVTSTGFTHDFAGWGDTWQPGTDNYNTTVQNDAEWFGKYNQYSKGAWRIDDDQIAKIHENEMVLPADFADEVRHEYDHQNVDMTFNIVIGQASNDQAIRFAQRMKMVLETQTVAAGNA